MIKFILRLVAKVSPRLSWFIRESYYTLNGWRFDDIKKSVTTSQGGSNINTLTFAASLDIVNARGAHQPKVAFVSTLPPDDTGIATCSFYSWLGSEHDVDLFCPVSDTDMFFALGHKIQTSHVAVLDVKTLLTADGIAKYENIVLSIGNSNHHIYIFECLQKIASFGSLDRVVLHIHDPCLLNLVQQGTASSNFQLFDLMRALYPGKLDDAVIDGSESWRTHAGLADLGVLGNRYFYSLGINKFIANSEAAAALLRQDLIGLPVSIETVFHPVFLPSGFDLAVAEQPKEDPEEIVVGSFGVPGPSKLTHVITDAVERLHQKGLKVRLVIAGFAAKRYAEAMQDQARGLNISVFDGPTDVQLATAMSTVDVAIQLRAKNLGESSGVVPQLLAMGKRVIVSPVGSFLEFGDAVTFTPEDVAAESLALMIEEEFRSTKSAEPAARYVHDHSPQKFREAFFATLDRLAEARGPAVRGNKMAESLVSSP